MPHSMPFANLAGIVLEAAQRTDLALENHNVVAQQPHFGIALDKASVTCSRDRPTFGMRNVSRTSARPW